MLREGREQWRGRGKVEVAWVGVEGECGSIERHRWGVRGCVHWERPLLLSSEHRRSSGLPSVKCDDVTCCDGQSRVANKLGETFPFRRFSSSAENCRTM